MQSIVQAPAGFIKRQSAASLFGDQLPRLQIGILGVVKKSFVTRPMRNMTEQALRDRVNFCVDKACELRRLPELWGVERIIDTLPDALVAHLDGRPWEPSKRQCWVPSDGA